MISSLGIFAAPYKPQASQLAAGLTEMAEKAGIRVRLQPHAAGEIGRPELGCSDEEAAASDILVTLSGDGGVLSAARVAAPIGTPILSIDLGRLGFLSAARPDYLEEAFAHLLSGDYEIEPRMMLDARVWRTVDGQVTDIGGSIGLNDAVVAKSALARILQISIIAGGELVATVRADGLVISTPTGSTAYALSAGGPIVHPEVPLLLLCPICPHSLAQRPFVVGPDEELEIVTEWEAEEVNEGELEAMLTVDGQIGVPLQSGDRVRVARSAVPTRLVRLPGAGFYGRLREKLRWS